MHTKLKRAVLALSAFAVGSAGLLISTGSASALPPGTAAAGPAVISPTTGNSATVFNFNPSPAPATCPGTGAAGHRWQTFMTPTSVDPATLTYGADGPIPVGTEFTQPMYSAGSPVVNNNPATSPAGLIVGAPASYDFSAYDMTFRPPAGTYFVGFACTFGPDTTKFWATTLTLTDNAAGGPAQFTFSEGAVPTAPVLTTATPGNGTCAAAFTGGAGATSFTVTANPGSITQTGAASPITVSGLTNGTAYTITVTATNGTGTSPVSNSLTCTPVEAARPPVQNLVATPGTGQVTVSFDAPTGPAPTDYTLVVTPGPVVGSPFTITGAGPYSQVVTGLTPGTLYTFQVTPNHPSPAVGTPLSITAAPYAAQVLNQEISVERPVGALVLTQRCGVHNAIDAFTAVDAFPGYPRTIVAEGATSSQVGTAPIDDDNAPLLDPEFPEYPFPSTPTYPTTCGVLLGTASLITTGALAGQYYAADGFLNEITVVDTRDTDIGWVVNGSMEAFVTTGDTFEGNYLGWDPQVGATSDGAYDQIVTAGPIVLPGTGVAADPALGLADGRTLASSLAGQGLGIAELDARLMLLIPAAANAGVYTGTLTFTAVDHNP